MTVTNVDALIRLHEGSRSFPYKDTKGILTIGIGHNLEAAGLPDSIIQAIYEHDKQQIVEALETRDWWTFLTLKGGQVRADAIIDLAFNVGVLGVDKFIHMIAAIRLGDWITAATELENSTLAAQRAKDLAALMRSGSYSALTP